MACGEVRGPAPRRNRDADWGAWPVEDYLAENYRELHPGDAAVIRHHSRFYRQFGPGSVGRSLECGAGPNLYPLMLGAAACRRVDALEPGAASLAYLRRQLTDGPDRSWQRFYRLCRELNPDLPPTLTGALAHVHLVPGDIRAVPEGTYDLASMNFVAESVTEDPGEFAEICREFIRSVHSGGRLVAAFMENMPSYRIGTTHYWPATPVDAATIHDTFVRETDRLRITRVAKDRTIPDYGDTGMVLLNAVRAPHSGAPHSGPRSA